MKKRKRSKTKRGALKKTGRRKKNNRLFLLVFFLLGIVVCLGFLLWSKKRPKVEIIPQEPTQKKTEAPHPSYASLDEVEDQIKGKVMENQGEILVFAETAPKQRTVRLEREDLKTMKLQKIITKSGFEKSKMDEIQEKVKSTREKKSEELGKDNLDTVKINTYDNELTKLLNEEALKLVEIKEAKIEEFTVGSEITFSRLGKNNFQLTVYPSEFSVYFPE